jgi:catecholate siderophore receptor
MDHPTRPERPTESALLRPTLGLLPVLALSAAPAFAQDAVQLDPLLVSGNEKSAETSYTLEKSANGKATAPLLDTPKSVTVITERQIEERGATSLQDVLRTTPGITLQAGEGGTPAGDIPYIRGFNAANDIMIDGIRNSSRTSYESFNLESIEITRGSDGAVMGAGGGGGTINLVTKAPQEDSFDRSSLSFGTGDYKRVTLDSNRGTGRIGARLNLMYQDANDLGGREGVTSERYGIAPSFRYDLTEQTSLTVGLYYYRNKDMPDYGIPMTTADTPAEYARGSGTVSDPYLPVDVATDTFYGLQDRDFGDRSNASGYLRLDHAFSDSLTWSTTLRHGKDKTKYYVTQPTSGADGQVTRGNKSTNRDNETTAFNSQLSGDIDLFGRQHSFALGVDISNSKATARKIIGTPSTATSAPYENPNSNDAWDGSFTYADDYGPISSIGTTQSRTLYLFDTVQLDPKWEANFGISYNHYKVTAHSFAQVSRGVYTPESIATSRTDLLNGSAGLVFKPTQNGRIYASISSSSSPAGEGAGTLSNASADTLITQDNLDPEETNTYEIGTKWALFNDQLMLSAALFQTEKTNARVTNVDGTTENLGKTRSQGIELGVAGQITEKWGVSAGYTYQDVKYVDNGYTNIGTTDAPNYVKSYLNGKQVTKIPRNSLALWTTYAYDDALTLGGGATYTDKRVQSYWNPNATAPAQYELPATWRLDLMASYKLTEDTLVQLNVNNVLDEQIYSDSHVGQHVIVEAGRNFAVTLNHRF